MTLVRGYSARELLEVLKKQGVYVSLPTICKAAQQGRLTALRLRGQWLIIPDEYLQRFIKDFSAPKRRGRKPKALKEAISSA